MTIINVYMNKLLKVFKGAKGFTLIELLVVIGILGILAAALIATIDPFEQLKKAQDANIKNTAVEFVNANTRYYSTHQAFSPNCTAASMVTLNGTNACLTDLIGDNELKGGFTTATDILTNIEYRGTTNITACFQPNSTSGKKDPNTKFQASGASGCPTTSLTCYWCSL